MFTTYIYNPLYNGLIFLLDMFPWMDVGVAVIVFTIIVKLILFPLSKKAVRTQVVMRTLQPKLDAIKKKYKDDRQKQAEETFAIYKEEGVNPFSSILLLIIQIPIIIALYFVFLRGGLPEINAEILYSFVGTPENIRMTFLGILDIAEKSLPLALLTGLSQYVQIRLSVPATPPKKDGSFGADFARSMQFQMKYGMPILIAVIAWTLPSMISLYWITSNLFTIGQELVIRRDPSLGK